MEQRSGSVTADGKTIGCKLELVVLDEKHYFVNAILKSVMVGEIIRNQRVQKGYSQEYMAHYLNISQNAYSKIERGETEVTVRRIYEIADVLGITVYELLPQAVASNSVNLHGLPELWMWLKIKVFGLFRRKGI